MWSEAQLKWYDKVNKARPTHIPHGTSADDIHKHMKKLQPSKWRQEGNRLIGETEAGTIVQFIPTDVQLKGTDEQGLPILERIVL